jgi:predicted Fe-S protein YdhL (DUF1289 family)
MSEEKYNILGMVKSPCVAICALDADDMCIGCYRTGDEITQWGEMDNEQKREVIKKVAEREQASGNIIAL